MADSIPVRAAARELMARGWSIVPVPRGGKKPVIEGWPELRLTERDLVEYFRGSESLGILTGGASGGLVDVDLDCDEAVQLAAAFLPGTSMRSGRPSRPESHLWYIATEVPVHTAFKDIDNKTVLLELRSNRHQTLVPPSVHPNGESYEWYGSLEPAAVSGSDLRRAVGRVAAATLLTRHWPKKPGSRHDLANALSGCLIRHGWSDGKVTEFVRLIAEAAHDNEVRDRIGAAKATARTVSIPRQSRGL